jgi:hypothetical protein
MPTKKQATGAVKTLRNFIKLCKEARAQHPTTAKKKRKKTKRDPAWFGNKKGHRKAAKKGARRKKAKLKTRRDPSSYKKKGRKGARKGRRRSMSGRRDPAGFRRGGLGRRRSAASPWYMTRDPE